MNKLIILSALLLTSCAHNNGYRKHNTAMIRYTVREYYAPVPLVSSNYPIIKKTRKPLIRSKKPVKIDCGRVLREINKCSI